MSAKHRTDYDEETTRRCERALVTLLGNLGPWRKRLYLAGGLAPRYIVGTLPEGVAGHIGTTDVDLVIGLALADNTPETYKTLQKNLTDSDFKRQSPSYQWARSVDGVTVKVEFLCEPEEDLNEESDVHHLNDESRAKANRIYTPKGEGLGSKISAFKVKGAALLRDDFVEYEIEAERLDGGGMSKVAVRVAGITSYVVLKIFAFQDRHEDKDSYDLVFTLLNHPGGPGQAGKVSAASAIHPSPVVQEAFVLLSERFVDIGHDGPAAYARFMAEVDDDDERSMVLRREAVAVVREFLAVATAQQNKQ